MTSPNEKKVAAITGATGAIGKAIALEFAKLNYSVVLIARNAPKCSRLANELIATTQNSSIIYKIVDLSQKSSIQDLANAWEGPLHVLINNAAITPPDRLETKEGIELQLATNVLGYYWMTEFFATHLAASPSSRVINVASYWAGGLDLADLEFKRRPYHNHAAYRQSKQANRMLTPVFADLLRKKGITVNACHPGDVNSALSNNLGFGGSQSPAAGARTPVWLATSNDLEDVTGKYFENLNEVTCSFGSQTDASIKLYEICSSY